MNREERQLLHGLYHRFHGVIGSDLVLKAGEVAWLVNTPIPANRAWQLPDGMTMKTYKIEDPDYMKVVTRTAAYAETPLRYLQQGGYLSYEMAGDAFRITLTIRAADFARVYDHWWGPSELWYKEHKDTLLGLVLTALVAVLTTLLTNFLTRQPH